MPPISEEVPVKEVALTRIGGLFSTGAVGVPLQNSPACNWDKVVGGKLLITLRQMVWGLLPYKRSSTPPTSAAVPEIPLCALVIVVPDIRNGVLAVMAPLKAESGI
ncbi:hypothetical protein [Adhaeribacter swui]|uniref:hypothetical protein n=1 Tax=Adhaeribacter swui TaxID=2086471 RepID=UPI00162886E8|nr:hypothetical protein [Adhaeribacter swui]